MVPVAELGPGQQHLAEDDRIGRPDEEYRNAVDHGFTVVVATHKGLDHSDLAGPAEQPGADRAAEERRKPVAPRE